MYPLERPLVVVGAARSGTSILAQTLAKHRRFVYPGELPAVWSIGAESHSSDIRTASEATPKVKRKIRSHLHQCLRTNEGDRLIDKTPSNCFRLPFLLEILPDAQVIHIIRDGRDVAFSAADVWSGGKIRARYGASRKENGTASLTVHQQVKRLPWMMRILQAKWQQTLDKYQQTGRFPSLRQLSRDGLAFFQRWLTPDSGATWGPRFPGLRAMRKEHSLFQTCALQWMLSVQAVRSATHALPEHRYIEVHFEDFVQRPFDEIERLLGFASEDASEEHILRMIEKVDRRKPSSRWHKRMSEKEVAGIEEVVGATLSDLGYTLSATAWGRRVEDARELSAVY